MKNGNIRKTIAVRELIKAYNELQDGGATHEELDAISLAIDTMIVAYDLDESLYAG
jgi:hypothetical protein